LAELTHDPIDTQRMLATATTAATGATLLFLGTTRQWTHGRETLWLTYEAFCEMALEKLRELEAQARARWPLVSCQITHRLGRVDVGEASVAIVVSSPHRHDAFVAGEWLIDTLKQVVPIWKEEHWSDGSTAWVHPGEERRV
ncbi:MAG: molybdenum cofactor biosynthesis protein MoaE, partial [Planctomycetota bacterium]